MEINDIEASNDTIYEEHNDFNLCWPMAIVSCPISGKPDLYSSYDACLSLEEAKKAIKAWKEAKDSLVYFAYVHDEEGHIIYYEVNITFLGDVNYDRGYKRYFSEEIKDSKKGNVLSLIKNKELR